MGQPGQTYIDRINERISGIQDTFRLTDEEIGRFVGHRGSKVKVGGWKHSFYWQGTTEEHNNYGWSEEAVLRQVFGYRKGPDAFLSHLVVESEKGLDVVAVVYRWRVGDYDYHKITTQVQSEESPIWTRDVKGDTSIYEDQTYIENELTRQLENGLIEYLGTVRGMQADTSRHFYNIYNSDGKALAHGYTPHLIQSDSSRPDPNEMLHRMQKYLEKIA